MGLSVQRFWAQVEKTDGCWIWTGYSPDGRTGRVTVNYHPVPATRIAWEQLNGPLPPDHLLRHTCGNERCVRPDHLREESRVVSPVDRFWRHVAKSDGCWLWTSKRRTQRGYGLLATGGRGSPNVLAHRFSWELHRGPTFKGMLVCHNCPGGDNPACVNPAHLYLGTNEENMDDARRKGQMVRGERNRSHKVTADEAAVIRAWWQGFQPFRPRYDGDTVDAMAVRPGSTSRRHFGGESLSNLILVTSDREEILVRRRGRIDVPRDQAKSMKHLLAAMREATTKMVADMKPRGFEWEPSYNLEFYGPFPHVDVSDDTSPDPYPELDRFDPGDLDRIRAIEDEQKRRKAKRADLNAARVDYEIVAVFRTKTTPYRRVVGGSKVWVPS